MAASTGPFTSDYHLRYRGYRLQATLYDGQALIHIREKLWYSRVATPEASTSTSGGRRRGQFTKRGVTLTTGEWTQFLELAADAEAACKSATSFGADLGERGQQLVVACHQGEWRINIRNYWDAKGDGKKMPTKIDVALSLHAFQRLRHVAEFIEEDLEELANGLESESHHQHEKDEALEAHHAQIQARLEDTAAVCSEWSMDGVFVIYTYHTYISYYSHIYIVFAFHFSVTLLNLFMFHFRIHSVFSLIHSCFFYFRDICFHSIDPCCFGHHLFRIWKMYRFHYCVYLSFTHTHTHIYIYVYIYSISQEICPRFLLCCALLWLYIDWFSHIHQAYFTGTVAI